MRLWHWTEWGWRALGLAIAAVMAMGAVSCGDEPTATPEPPTLTPAPTPTVVPTAPPTAAPTVAPTATPTAAPTPTVPATATPTAAPTAVPTAAPTPTVAPAPLADELRSAKERVTSPQATNRELAELVRGNSAFAFDLYGALREGGGNLFYSPYSISLALAMAYAGAGGETAREMADTLHFLLAQDSLHPAFNSLDLALASRGKGSEEDDFELSIANAVWGQQGYQFLDGFLDVLAENYGAGVRPVDFVGAAEAARLGINRWVSEQTEDRIRDLLPQGAIDRYTRAVLTNAIYFKAAWALPFDEGGTRDRRFHLLDGSEANVPMMTRTASFRYAEGNGYQAVELPYEGDSASMVVLLPDRGLFSEFEARLDAGLVDDIAWEQGRLDVSLTMPSFEFESDLGLADALAALGMTKAFDDEQADFSGMNGLTCAVSDECLYVRDVVHKAFVSVDEEGTEAAAATAVVIAVPTSVVERVVVRVDRPFVFLIRDNETGALLFVGRVLDPRSAS